MQPELSIHVIRVVYNFLDVFLKELSRLPPKWENECSIDLVLGTQPIDILMSLMNRIELRELHHQLLALQRKKFIRYSSSSWGAPVLLTERKDGTLRLCINYQELNRATIKKRYLLPHINNLFDWLLGTLMFFKVHLKSGFHQIRVWTENISKMTFYCWYNHFKFQVMPLGLINIQ